MSKDIKHTSTIRQSAQRWSGVYSEGEKASGCQGGSPDIGLGLEEVEFTVDCLFLLLKVKSSLQRPL